MFDKMNMRLCTVGGRRAVFHKWVIFLDPAVTKFCPCKICAGGVEYDLMQKE